jgi:hypothetical protein
MKRHYGQFAIASALIIAAIIFAFAIRGLTRSIESAIKGKTGPNSSGKFQVAVVRGPKDSVIALRIDTTTGTTEIFKTDEINLLTEAYLSKLKARPGVTVEEMNQTAPRGSIWAIPNYWKPLAEQTEGLELKSLPEK